jgi:hypothetical protein
MLVIHERRTQSHTHTNTHTHTHSIAILPTISRKRAITWLAESVALQPCTTALPTSPRTLHANTIPDLSTRLSSNLHGTRGRERGREKRG